MISLVTKSICRTARMTTTSCGSKKINTNSIHKRSISSAVLLFRRNPTNNYYSSQQQQLQQRRQQAMFPGSVTFTQHQQQQTRSVFIQTADTPNPESLKFLPTGKDVLDQTHDDDTSGYYVTKSDKADDILRSPLAKNLFDIEGVKAIYLGAEFVTVTKYAEHKWKLLRPQIFEVLMEWVDSGKPALLDKPEITDTTILDDDDEVVAMIKELIEARIRPAVQEDGGDIRYVGFDEETGIVTVELAGSCVGCPSSSITLKQGVENMLQHYVPEVQGVVALEEEQEEGSITDESTEEGGSAQKQRSYEERLAAAGIPFSE